jgi:phenylpropionate dioxygenase-like ring-hydroxylating dioxygenase large terminal subunit
MPEVSTITGAPKKASSRGEELRFRSEDEFHQCWYPVALSSEVPAGALVGAPFLDGKVVVFRTSDDAVHVMSAYCRHLGADLSVGSIADDRLQCAFHCWRYDVTGACVEIPAGDTPPPRARLFVYPVAESLGIIWAFNAEEPLHPPPNFGCAEADLVIDAYRNPVTMPIDSSVVFLNSFDLQHFRVVHKLKIEVDPDRFKEEDHTLTYQAKIVAAEFGEIMQNRKLWGVNTVTIESDRSGRPLYLMHSLCPTSQKSTQGFLVNATSKDASSSSSVRVEEVLRAAREYSLRLIAEDAPIFETIKFRRDCMTASDRILAYGIQYVMRYPRAHPGREMIR